MSVALAVLVVVFVAAMVGGAIWLIFTVADAWQQNAQDVLNSGRRRRREGSSRSDPPEEEER